MTTQADIKYFAEEAVERMFLNRPQAIKFVKRCAQDIDPVTIERVVDQVFVKGYQPELK